MRSALPGSEIKCWAPLQQDREGVEPGGSVWVVLAAAPASPAKPGLLFFVEKTNCQPYIGTSTKTPGKKTKIRPKPVFVKRKCEQKGPKKVSTFSTRFHVVSNVFPKYQMLTF